MSKVRLLMKIDSVPVCCEIQKIHYITEAGYNFSISRPIQRFSTLLKPNKMLACHIREIRRLYRTEYRHSLASVSVAITRMHHFHYLRCSVPGDWANSLPYRAGPLSCHCWKPKKELRLLRIASVLFSDAQI